MEKLDKLSSEGLGKLIKDQNPNKDEKDKRNIYKIKGEPVEDDRSQGIKNAEKSIPSRLEKLDPENARSIEGWGIYFGIREPSEGLFDKLIEKGARVNENKDGTWTIRKVE